MCKNANVYTLAMQWNEREEGMAADGASKDAAFAIVQTIASMEREGKLIKSRGNVCLCIMNNASDWGERAKGRNSSTRHKAN